MPEEYPYYTDKAIEVATEGIRAEAQKWFGFSDQMREIGIAMSTMTIEPTGFAVVDISGVVTTPDQWGAYKTTQQWLTALFGDAIDKMERFGEALNKCADEYDSTDGQSAQSFDQIAKS
jgi:hypothetical protein